MPNFYYADPHFFDERALARLASTRPFSSVEDMNAFIVQEHNTVVDDDSDVFIIGTFAAADNANDLREMFDALKGRKHLIVGANNPAEVLELPWASVRTNATVIDCGEHIYLSALALESWPGMADGHLHLHGNSYGRLPSKPNAIDVGLDAWQLCPITAAEAMNHLFMQQSAEVGLESAVRL